MLILAGGAPGVGFLRQASGGAKVRVWPGMGPGVWEDTMSNTRYEPSPTKQQARFAAGRQDRINAFRGVVAGLPTLDITPKEKASALACAAKALLTEATLRVASEVAGDHKDLASGLKAAREAGFKPPAKAKAKADAAPEPAPEPPAPSPSM